MQLVTNVSYNFQIILYGQIIRRSANRFGTDRLDEG